MISTLEEYLIAVWINTKYKNYAIKLKNEIIVLYLPVYKSKIKVVKAFALDQRVRKSMHSISIQLHCFKYTCSKSTGSSCGVTQALFSFAFFCILHYFFIVCTLQSTNTGTCIWQFDSLPYAFSMCSFLWSIGIDIWHLCSLRGILCLHFQFLNSYMHILLNLQLTVLKD
jgi:hypothetical protein